MSVTRYPPDGNDWIECYRAGASLAKLAKQYRAAAETVRWWLIEAGEPRLAWLALDHARAVVPDRELFLGLWKGAPCFAVEVEGSADPAAGPLAGLGAFHEMREAAAMLPGPDAAMAGAAKSLFDWRRRHGFCAACGVESENACGGWKRVCPAARRSSTMSKRWRTSRASWSTAPPGFRKSAPPIRQARSCFP